MRHRVTPNGNISGSLKADGRAGAERDDGCEHRDHGNDGEQGTLDHGQGSLAQAAVE